MLLTRLPDRDDERGVAMVTVVILVVVCFTVASVVAASTIFGVRQTADDQARLQALAAAEGGRDYALSQLTGGCTTSYSNPPGDPTFTATVYWVADSDPASHQPPATVPGAAACYPADATTGFVGVQSVGTAADGRTRKTVLAWYPRTASPSGVGGGIAGAIVQGGSDQTKPSIQGMQEAGGTVIYDATSATAFNCNNVTVSAAGDLVLWQSPDSTASSVDFGTCNHTTIGGSLYAYGNVAIGNGMVVRQNIVSLHGSVTVGTGAEVDGDVWTATGATKQGTVNGTVHAAGQMPPSLPAAFSQKYLWTDLIKADMPLSDLADYTVRTVTSCNTAGWLTGIANVATQNTIVDATACTSFKIYNGLSLAHDLTVLLPNISVDLNGATVTSTDGAEHEFNVIQLDQDPSQAAKDHKPDCPASNVDLNVSGFTMSDPINGLAYTPCDIKAGTNSGQWRGQLFAGDYPAGFESNDLIVYVPVTRVPGVVNAGGFAAGGNVVMTAALGTTLSGQTES